MIKLMNILHEIKVTPPDSFFSSSTIKDYIIPYITEEISDIYEIDIFSFLSSTEIETILYPFIIDQMIFNNHELLINGEEVLVSYNNQNLVTDKDIEDYIDTNPEISKYLIKLVINFYYENIDFNKLFELVKNQVKQDKIESDKEGEIGRAHV